MLELLGTILCVKLFSRPGKLHQRASLKMTGSTDNLGNAYAVSRAMSTKWPLTVLLIELSEELRSRKVALGLDWLPREENQEAADLSNMKTTDFDESLRVHVAAADLRWHVLDEMMQASQELFNAIVVERAACASRAAASGFGRGRRVRLGPW